MTREFMHDYAEFFYSYIEICVAFYDNYTDTYLIGVYIRI